MLFFGKIGRVASEEVVRVSKNAVLLYGLDACPLNNSDKSSLDFVATRFLMKLFETINIVIIRECQAFFNFVSPSELLMQRTNNFVAKYASSHNGVCRYASMI